VNILAHRTVIVVTTKNVSEKKSCALGWRPGANSNQNPKE
jgi:hypothetical protein